MNYDFITKNRKNIAPTNATLQTQERLVKNPKSSFFSGAHYSNFSFYLLCWAKQKKEDPSGIGTVAFMSGEAEAIRRVLSVPSSPNSNWPSSSSARKSSKSIRKCHKPYIYLFFEEKTKNELSLGMGLFFFWLLLLLMDGLCCSSLQLSLLTGFEPVPGSPRGLAGSGIPPTFSEGSCW